jgi:hypothetical protein
VRTAFGISDSVDFDKSEVGAGDWAEPKTSSSSTASHPHGRSWAPRDTSEGQETGALSLTVHEHGLHLLYGTKNDRGEPIRISELIPFSYTRAGFGGRRQWLQCLRCGRSGGRAAIRCDRSARESGASSL